MTWRGSAAYIAVNPHHVLSLRARCSKHRAARAASRTPALHRRDARDRVDQPEASGGEEDPRPGAVLVGVRFGEQVGGAHVDEEAGVDGEDVTEGVVGNVDQGADDGPEQ